MCCNGQSKHRSSFPRHLRVQVESISILKFLSQSALMRILTFLSSHWSKFKQPSHMLSVLNKNPKKTCIPLAPFFSIEETWRIHVSARKIFFKTVMEIQKLKIGVGMSAKIIKVVVSRKWMLSFNAGSCVLRCGPGDVELVFPSSSQHASSRWHIDTCSQFTNMLCIREYYPQLERKLSDVVMNSIVTRLR